MNPWKCEQCMTDIDGEYDDLCQACFYEMNGTELRADQARMENIEK